MMKELIIFVVLFSMASCKKDKEDSIFVSTAIDISYFDKDSNDLLDPNNHDSYKEADIDIYYLINGEKVKQYQGNLESPEFFFISNEIREGKYFMAVFANHKNLDENNRAITYINFGDNEED